MIEHHVQKTILEQLAVVDTAHFADLRPKHIDSNTFTYHIKQLLRDGLVEKLEDGTYRLTNIGMFLGKNARLSEAEWLLKPFTQILLAIKSPKGWLLAERDHQPIPNSVVLPILEPSTEQGILSFGQEQLNGLFSINSKLRVAGTAYITIHSKERLETMTHNTVLHTKITDNPLLPEGYFWSKEHHSNFYPGMPEIMEACVSKDLFWLDLQYAI